VERGAGAESEAPKKENPDAKREVRSRGAERDRTVGLLNAIEALSQLSYSPDTDSRRRGIN
jgi:hypothetical protein